MFVAGALGYGAQDLDAVAGRGGPHQIRPHQG